MINAELIAKTLKSVGVKRVFIFPGGTIAPLLDALIKEGIEYVCPRNEQGAGYAALGAAKVSGFPQVVMVTSGPGVTNVMTPVADAYYDSVPLLVFTGQVATKDINKEKRVRQTGFQEVDTTGMYQSVTKRAHLLSLEDDISKTIFDLFNLTRNERSGPVLCDLPMDVQKAEAKSTEIYSPSVEIDSFNYDGDEKPFVELNNLINSAKRPIILAGNGIYLADTVQEFRSFVEACHIPVVCSLPGVGTIPSDHPLAFSFLGHTGEYFANLAAYNADLVIGLGARFDLRQTGSEVKAFMENKTIVRVDIDEKELNNGRVQGGLHFQMHLKDFFAEFEKHSAFVCHRSEEWIGQLREWKQEFHSSQFYQGPKLYSYDIISAVDKYTKGKKVIVTTGVGSHQQLAARFFTYDYPTRRFLTSAGHGAMGHDVPTMIGAMLDQDKDTMGIVFVGDGSFQMNIQELATIRELNLPVKIFVLDNRRLGVVSQFQNQFFGSDPGCGNKQNPSFSAIGIAYGMSGYSIWEKDQISFILKNVFMEQGPSIIHCHIDYSEETYPMLLGGQRMDQMYPFNR
ncbi:MAG TPA: thiamine pyrophosphate-binding protein [Candidatus Paceibacterota bacterium]